MKDFGVASREGYSSDGFYARKIYRETETGAELSYVENPLTAGVVDQVFPQDSRSMSQLPDSSVHLMVTSPPYNVGKQYDHDLSLQEYLAMLRDVFRECHRVLVPGGRACVNVANLGRKPYIPLHAHVIEQMNQLGFMMRGEIIWDKSASAGTSTAWGSWKSATNPILRDVHEYVLVFSKGLYRRERNGRKDTITGAEFLEWTKSAWAFPAESARRVKHPAPFPVELPYRLIQLYTFAGDIVLDPFGGSGTTALAALKAGRHFVLFDISKEYVRLAIERIREFTGRQTPGEPHHE